MGGNVVEDGGYSSLKDVKLDFKNGAFTLCFWVYLESTPYPSTLLQQHHPDIPSKAPFLVLNEKKEMMLYPMLFLHKEAPNPSNLTDEMETRSARTKSAVPLKKWVHIGCEVSTDILRLYIDGEIAADVSVTCTLDKDSQEHGPRRSSLLGPEEDDSIEGYVHGLEILPLTSTIKDHFVKDPPVQLEIDSSSATNIEEDSDGVWSVVGGNASCRRNFSLDVVLTDAFGKPANKEMEVVASLSYAENNAPVEKPHDAEAPLLTSYDGIEFAAWDRPSKLVKSRASFKLKISQLSSECDNKLFRIKFHIPSMGRYPFLEVFSRSIRSISRNTSTRPSTLIWKRSTSSMHVLNGTSGLDEGSLELVQNIVREAKPSLSSKRIKLGQGKPFVMLNLDNSIKRVDEEGNSHAGTNNEDVRSNGRTSDGGPEMHEETDNCSSDTESSEATNSCKSIGSNGSPVSDLTVFKYCLGGLTEKSHLLRDIAISASEEELVNFAQQVSHFSGCLHHRNQIRISKRLIEDGINAWNLMSQNKYPVLWDKMALVLNEQFMKIACSRNRSLAQQDFETLRRIGGCQELVGQENFEKIWSWLYPVAFALSQERLNEMWDSRWIVGLIRKEEAESSLQGPGGLQEPGTFVLRFPTSRSWPHPDAGNLIITYVGSDYAIHNRLLNLDFIYSSGAEEMRLKSLKDMLLEEQELSRLGRITRGFQLA